MALETKLSRRSLRLRADVPEPDVIDLTPFIAPGLWVLIATACLLLGGASLDLNASESKLGLSALEPLQPFGQVNGGWDPTVWAGSIIPSRLWELAGRMRASAAAVRWPAVIAGLFLGLILSRVGTRTSGSRAGVLVGLCWFGSVGVIDHSATSGLDLLLGLGVVGCLSRLLTKGSDWVAGLFLAWAFLAGGWPPVALVALATIVIGRPGSGLNLRLLLPPVVAAIGWSVWCLKAAAPELWGAALAWPITQSSTWDLIPGVALIAFPWSPFALLAASRSVRAGWDSRARSLVKGWSQVVGASLLIGTLIPGMALSARVAALAGLAMISGFVFESLWNASSDLSRIAKNGLRTALILVGGVWVLGVVLYGGYLSFAVSYYRGVAILAMALAGLVAILTVLAVRETSGKVALGALAVIVIGLKLGHWGYYVPEWNYRQSQGPWGRAIGQWVPPNRTIYVTHEWPPDLTFAIGRPVRRIVNPALLESQPGLSPKFVLLHEEEFKHWPEQVGKLVKVASFLDEFGSGRVLARTEGAFSWKQR